MSNKELRKCAYLKMSPATKSVLFVLADMANDGSSECFPSIECISQRTCLGRTTVIKAIKQLEGRGYLKATRNKGRSTRYRLTLPSLSANSEEQPAATLVEAATRSVQNSQELGSAGEPHESVGRTLTINNPFQSTNNLLADERVDESVLSQFKIFWDLYPRQIGLLAARQAWANCRFTKQGVLRILERLDTWKKSDGWTKENGRFIPSPARWLAEKRWVEKTDGRLSATTKPESWLELQSSVDAMAIRLGLDPWNSDAFNRGNGENYLVFRDRIKRAFYRHDSSKPSEGGSE